MVVNISKDGFQLLLILLMAGLRRWTSDFRMRSGPPDCLNHFVQYSKSRLCLLKKNQRFVSGSGGANI